MLTPDEIHDVAALADKLRARRMDRFGNHYGEAPQTPQEDADDAFRLAMGETPFYDD